MWSVSYPRFLFPQARSNVLGENTVLWCCRISKDWGLVRASQMLSQNCIVSKERDISPEQRTPDLVLIETNEIRGGCQHLKINMSASRPKTRGFLSKEKTQPQNGINGFGGDNRIAFSHEYVGKL